MNDCLPKDTKILFAAVFIQLADRLSGNILAFGRNLPEKTWEICQKKKLSYLDQEAASLTWLLMRNKQTEKARRKFRPIKLSFLPQDSSKLILSKIIEFFLLSIYKEHTKNLHFCEFFDIQR